MYMLQNDYHKHPYAHIVVFSYVVRTFKIFLNFLIYNSVLLIIVTKLYLHPQNRTEQNVFIL